MTLVAEVQAALFKEFPTANVDARSGDVSLNIQTPLNMKAMAKQSDQVYRIIEQIQEIRKCSVHCDPAISPD